MSLNSERQQLVEDNMGLAYYILHHDYPTFTGDEDLTQCALLGLCQAAEKWDEKKGLFSTFAGKCIRNEINKEFIRRKPHSKNISLSSVVVDDKTLEDVLAGEEDVSIMDDNFYSSLTGDEISVFELTTAGCDTHEIAEQLNMNIQKVNKLLRIVRKKWKRFDQN